MTLNLYNNQDSTKPIYHHHPQKGLLNDPNGLIQWNGKYHVFYQLNSNDTTHENKSWGHSTSVDLLHWKREKSALEPTDYFDKDGCYSGSAIVHDSTLYLFYTGNVINEFGERESYQCLATSEDGENFKKHGPLIKNIPGYTAHVRDPKVWQETENSWKMILGAQRDDKTGCVLIYQSNNLFDWFFLGELDTGIKEFGYMWECPDLVVNSTESLLIFSPQGIPAQGYNYQNIYQSGYILGSYQNDNIFQKHTNFIELDHGFEFYAPQTFKDETGRLLLYAWMGAMEPNVEKSVPSIKDKWLHILSIPREIKIKNNVLFQKPASELKQLRQNKKTFPLMMNQQVKIDNLSTELKLYLEHDTTDFLIKLFGDIEIEWQAEDRLFSVYRTNWYSGEKEVRSIVLESLLKKIDCYFDLNSLEIFINDGEKVFSLRMYHEDIYPSIELKKGLKIFKEVVTYKLGY